MKLKLMSAHAHAPNISTSQVADDTRLSFVYTVRLIKIRKAPWRSI